MRDHVTEVKETAAATGILFVIKHTDLSTLGPSCRSG